MAISSETVGRLLASGRNYASMFVGLVGGIGLMTAAQSKGLGEAFTEIFSGLNMIAHGASSAWQILIVAFPIVGVILAKWASNSAKVDNQAAAVQAAVKDPNAPVSLEAKAAILDATANLAEVKKDRPIEVTDPVLANAVPARNVVAKP